MGVTKTGEWSCRWANDDEVTSGAEFSACGKYRYSLWRRWNWNGHANNVMFIGLNPSTADESKDDPTVRRCIRFAKDWCYDGLIMMNAFAFRSTDPKGMFAASDPIGPQNDEALAYQRTRAGLIIAAWGVNCTKARELDVCRVIGKTVHCLGRTKEGRPRHPLYVKADVKPEVFWSPEDEVL